MEEGEAGLREDASVRSGQVEDVSGDDEVVEAITVHITGCADGVRILREELIGRVRSPRHVEGSPATTEGDEGHALS